LAESDRVSNRNPALKPLLAAPSPWRRSSPRMADIAPQQVPRGRSRGNRARFC
jgi:hypothetical protein